MLVASLTGIEGGASCQVVVAENWGAWCGRLWLGRLRWLVSCGALREKASGLPALRRLLGAGGPSPSEESSSLSLSLLSLSLSGIGRLSTEGRLSSSSEDESDGRRFCLGRDPGRRLEKEEPLTGCCDEEAAVWTCVFDVREVFDVSSLFCVSCVCVSCVTVVAVPVASFSAARGSDI